MLTQKCLFNMFAGLFAVLETEGCYI